MKKIIAIIATLMIIIAIGLIILSTGGKMSSVFINDYAISEDGDEMTLKVGVGSSIGYVRTVKTKKIENKLYLTFYSTYGLNSTIGANNVFKIDLNPTIDEIYLYSGDKKYDLKLQRNAETTQWVRVK